MSARPNILSSLNSAIMRRLSCLGVFALLCCAGLLPAVVDYGVVETFDYPTTTTSVVGQNGGTGWAGAWTIANAKGAPYNNNTLADIPYGEGKYIDYPGMAEKGLQHMKWWTATGTSPQSLSRSFQTPLVDNGQTYWMSFIIQSFNQKYRAGLWLKGYDGAGTTSLLSMYSATINVPAYYFLDDTSTGNSKATTPSLLVPTSSAWPQTNMFVFKIVTSGVTGLVDDVVTVYVNPVLSTDPSTWGSIATTRTINLSAGITGITLKSNNNANISSYAAFDEFRVGNTVQSVLGSNENQAPVAVLDVEYMGSNTSPFTATLTGAGSSDPDGDALHYTFTTGDGQTIESDVPNVDHTWINNTYGPIDFDLSLTVTDIHGASSTATSLITVDENLVDVVIANGSGDKLCLIGETITITADAAPSGMVFDAWTGFTTGVTDVHSATTQFLVPNPDNYIDWPWGLDTLTATYKAIVPTNGVTLVAESFDYAGTSVATQNGGIGWKSGWTITNPKPAPYNVTLESGWILSDPFITPTPMHLHWWTATGTTSKPQVIARSFATNITDTSQNTYWMAFVLQSYTQKLRAGLWLNGYAASSLISMYSSHISAPQYYLLDDVTTNGSQNQLFNSELGGYSSQNLFLIKIEISGVTGLVDDKVTAYVNPYSFNSAGPTGQMATITRTINLSGGISGISLKTNNNTNANSIANFDEFRIGTTWQAALSTIVAPSGIATTGPQHDTLMGTWQTIAP